MPKKVLYHITSERTRAMYPREEKSSAPAINVPELWPQLCTQGRLEEASKLWGCFILMCSDCNRAFSNLSTLHEHEQTAHGKSSPCQACAQGLKHWTESINGDTCPICSKALFDKHTLKDHVNKVHNETPTIVSNLNILIADNASRITVLYLATDSSNLL